MGSDLSDRNIYDEARNRIHAKNGETEDTREVVSSPLLSLYPSLGITLRSTRVNYVLCGNGFHSLSNIESNKSKCCPALRGAWVPAFAGTHAELLYDS